MSLRYIEALIRCAQDDDEPGDEFCSCEETTDGFYTCPQCREWQEHKLREARERDRQRRATAKDVPELEPPF